MGVTNVTVQRPEDWEAITMKRDEQLQQIARARKQWKWTLGRAVDMESSRHVSLLHSSKV